MNELEQALSTLRSYGLLGRAQSIQAGQFVVHLGPPEVASTALRDATPEDEQAALEQAMYAASMGGVPGAA